MTNMVLNNPYNEAFAVLLNDLVCRFHHTYLDLWLEAMTMKL